MTAVAIVLIVWCLLSIPFTFLFIGLCNRGRGRCFFHGFNRRQVIETDTWEYFECSHCGQREAEQIEGTNGDGPVNQLWLNGAPWCG